MQNADVLWLKHANFPDLEHSLRQTLSSCSSVLDLENLLRRINPLLQDERWGQKERTTLAKLRQQAYDKKRKTKILEPRSDLELFLDPDLTTQPRSETHHLAGENIMMSTATFQKSVSLSKPFLEGFMSALSKIDGEKFAKALPPFCVWCFMLSVSVYFVWQQSIEIYQSAGFINPLHAAAGGLAMILGFSAYFSYARTLLALMACLYAGGFEAYLMVAGTVQDERVQSAKQISSMPELIFLQFKAEAALAEYKQEQARHLDPQSKVYQNQWFEKTHLVPALAASEAAFAALESKKDELTIQLSMANPQRIKILYRLGLVLLCMIFAHRFFRAIFGEDARISMVE